MSDPFATHYANDTTTTGSGFDEHSDETLMRDRKLQSIVPRSSVASSALTTVIAIMAFLSSLTLGAVTMVNDTAQGWQSDIAREVTVQVRPIADVDFEKAVLNVRQIAGSFAGVAAVTVVDDAAMSRLLEPWLGGGLNLEELPVPRLITLEIDEDTPPDLDALRIRIEQTVPGATLDDHRAWVGRLTTMARTTIVIGSLVFLLIMAATVLTVVFATRGAMSGNKHVIEVLHFVGAEQSYIASQFQTHFLMLGLKGALAGGITAIVCFVMLGIWTSNTLANPATEQVTALFGTFSVGLAGYVGTLLLIAGIALLTALTSRLTVFRYVGTLDRSGTDQFADGD